MPRCDVSIVTPSFNMLPYLMRCCRSVADQGVPHEHIVVDACSTDGTPEWLRTAPAIISIVEKDRGMYDAVNKGWRQAHADIISYLNCDEQYLPGTLRTVRDYFAAHPRVDIVYGDALLIQPSGALLAFRKSYPLRWPYVLASHLYVLSCTIFLRRRIIDDGYSFDVSWRDLGDQDFIVRLLRDGYRAARIPQFLSAFTMTGSNMSAGENARREIQRALLEAPAWVRLLHHPLNAIRLLEKAGRGAYRTSLPIRYQVFASGDAEERTEYTSARVSSAWPTA
jgi:glycosyltransferase involved in cell wall biosynthesis